jgi:hypothetical protein
MHFCTSLPQQYISSEHNLTAIFFNAQPLPCVRKSKNEMRRCVRHGAENLRGLWNVNTHPAVLAVPFDGSIGESEQRVIASAADVLSGMHFGPPLPHQYISSEHNFAVIFFNTQPLPRGVTPIS